MPGYSFKGQVLTCLPDVGNPHPHPYAPAEIIQAFGEFLSKSQPAAHSSNAKDTGGAQAYEEFWHAPERLWRHDIEEVEIEAILVRCDKLLCVCIF